MAKVRTAVIGVGSLGRHHARWYKSIEESELIGVYDINRERCRDIALKWDVTAFESLDEVIEKAEAVSIAVPTSEHYKVAEPVIRNKIHCLIEKPVTSTFDEAVRLANLAKDYGVVATVGHIERFNPAVRALKKYSIKPRFIEAHRLAAFDPRGTDVAVILDLMVHDIDLSLHLVNSPIKKIDASAVAVISDHADIANARLTFENGAVANLTASRISLKPMRKLRLFQKSGYFSLDLAEKQADIYRLDTDVADDEEGMRVPLGKSGHNVVYNKDLAGDEDMLGMELGSFIKAIVNKATPEVTMEQACEALRAAIEIDKIGINGAVS